MADVPAAEPLQGFPGLHEILAPYGVDWLRERFAQPRVEALRAPASRLEGLLDWPELREVATSQRIAIKNLRITRSDVTLPVEYYRTSRGVDAATLDRLLESNASVIVNRLELLLPQIGAVANVIAALVPDEVRVTAFTTQGPGGALPLHYDPVDLLIVQIEGRKRWLIHGPPVLDPVRGMTRPKPPTGLPLSDAVVEAGDLLFVPAGYWHRCENGPGRSIHLGFAMRRPNAADMLGAFAKALCDEPLFRVPISRLATAESRARHADAIRTAIAQRLALLDFEDPVAPMRGPAEDRSTD